MPHPEEPEPVAALEPGGAFEPPESGSASVAPESSPAARPSDEAASKSASLYVGTTHRQTG